MKKIIGGFLAAMIFLVPAGCNKSEGPAIEQTQTDTTQEAPQQTQQTQQTAISQEQLFKDYINSTLIPKYGALIANNQSGIMNKPETDWLKPEGVLSVYVEDLDNDGSKEMIAFYFKNGSPVHGGMNTTHVMAADVYEIKDEVVTLADKQDIAVYHSFAQTPVALYSNHHLEDEFYATLVNTDEKKLIVCEYSTVSTVFSDGMFESWWALEYNGYKLDVDFTVSLAGPGSADFEYTGYDLENGNVKSEEILYTEYDEQSKYKSANQAVKAYFEAQGVSCIEAEKGSILQNNQYATKLFSYSVAPQSVDYNNPKVTMKLSIEDNSNIFPRG